MATSDSRADGDDRDFQSSELGTKEFWDSAYEREVENFEEIGDVGEIWFGEDTMEKILDWLEECGQISTGSDIIDLGSGNGMMCIELRKRGFTSLTGVDYSDLAVMLATSVAKSEGFEDITFVTGDLSSTERPNPCTSLNRKYNMVIDKGTYDAISLMPEGALAARRGYRDTVKHLMDKDTFFSLTSCNWTKEQLLEFFTGPGDLTLTHQIPFRTFQFGGQTGSTVTSLVFQLKS